MIRKYQPQDLEHIMKIWLETNLAAHGFIPAEYWNEQYEAVKEALPQADILIYEEEGTVLGLSLIHIFLRRFTLLRQRR